MKPSVLAPELRDFQSQKHLERFVQQPTRRVVACVFRDVEPRIDYGPSFREIPPTEEERAKETGGRRTVRQ